MKGGSTNTSGSGGNKGSSKLVRIVESPIKALCRARDMYVNGMTGIADRASSRGIGSRHPSGIPTSYHTARFSRTGSSSSNSEDDLRELLRAATGSAGTSPAGPRSMAVQRSQSAGMARIDEDRPCEFDGVDIALAAVPRSKSYDVRAQARRLDDMSPSRMSPAQ